MEGITSLELLKLIHMSSAVFMAGLIWVIQLVHYPAFRFVPEQDFVSFERFHSTRITFIVGPVMVIEMMSGLGLVWFTQFNPVWILNMGALGLIWLSTLTLSIPCHNRLGQGKDVDTINRLVVTNWPRTILWSLRSLALAALL